MEIATDDGDTNQSCQQITPEICLLWMEKFDHMNKVFDSLVEERNNALSMCEKLEKENESLKEQIVQCEEVEKLTKENGKLRKEIHDLKQKQESINSSCRAMFQSFETVHKKMLAIPIKAEVCAGPEVIQSSSNESEEIPISNESEEIPISNESEEIPISNESRRADEISMPVSLGESKPIDYHKCFTDENSFLKMIADELKSTRVEVRAPSSCVPSGASQKSAKEKHRTLDRRNPTLGGVSEDMKLLDGYCSIASKRKLANEISYSESKKVKANENIFTSEESRALISDICDEIFMSQGSSMSIFTKRKLAIMSNEQSKGANVSDRITSKENSSNDSSKERLLDSQRDDSSINASFRQSNKDQRMSKQFNDLEFGSSDPGRRSNPMNERNIRHKTRERTDRDKRN